MKQAPDHRAIVGTRLRQLDAAISPRRTLEAYECEALVDAWCSLPAEASYVTRPPAVDAALDEAQREGGVEGVACLVRCLMLHAASRSLDALPSRDDLAPIRHHFERAFASMLGDAVAAEPRSLDPRTRDLIQKDLAVLVLRAWPTGTMLVEPRSAFPRRELLSTGSLRQRMSGVTTVLCNWPNKPYYQQHLYDRFLSRVTPQGWRECLHCTADLLDRDRAARGVMGGGWLWDPALSSNQFKIGFLRSIPARFGASFHAIRSSANTPENATAGSLERTEAFARGSYEPRDFLMIWSRSDIERWARGVGR